MATILIRLELRDGVNAERVLHMATVMLGEGALRADIDRDFGGDAVEMVTAEIDSHAHCTCSCHEPCDDDCEGC